MPEKKKLIPVTITRSNWSRGDLIRNCLFLDQKTVDDAVAGYNSSEGPKLSESRTPKIGGKCCLGFACNAVGVSDENMAGKGMPNDLVGLSRDLVKLTMLKPDYDDEDQLVTFETQQWVQDAQEVNDAPIGANMYIVSLCDYDDNYDRIALKDEHHRERLIAQLFMIGGMFVTFVD
jgi:hypothetical protein